MKEIRQTEDWQDGRDLVQDEEGADVGDGGVAERGGVAAEPGGEAGVKAGESVLGGFMVGGETTAWKALADQRGMVCLPPNGS